MKLLDLFSGEGGAGMGNHPAGKALDRQMRQVAEIASVTGLDVAALREALTERDDEHEGGGGA